jgi:hypothetical protein
MSMSLANQGLVGHVVQVVCAVAVPRAIGPFVFFLLIGCSLLQSGCQVFRGFGVKAAPAPTVFQAQPTQADLLSKLNEHASRVRQLQSNVSLEIPGAPRLSGTLILERPNRIRLKAGIGGISEMGFDVGSNSELFWIWNKASLPGQPPPAIYFAQQSDYHRIRQVASIPIDPQWIIDASGLVEFSPNDVHHGPYMENGMMKIATIQRTSDGHVTRVSVIDPKTALIRQQAFYDTNNQRIGYIVSEQFEYFQEEGVSLPKRIELHLTPSQGEPLKVGINASQYRINQFFGNPDQTWSMPRPDGVRLINLAEAPGLIQ